MKAPASCMALPPHDRSDGSVSEGRGHLWKRDDRVPRAVRTEDDPFGEEHPPSVAEHSPYVADACVDGRHLFDIIESAAWREVYDATGEEYSHDEATFRARLTCVRCGKVTEWEGTRQTRSIGRLQVAPLMAGDLVAQHVGGELDRHGHDYSEWIIYRAGAAVGRMAWGRGSRGREFHAGRLDEWPGGELVEGNDPASALRKIARHEARVGSLAGAR